MKSNLEKELGVYEEGLKCGGNKEKIKPYDEGSGMICFRYVASGVTFLGVFGVAVGGVMAMFNDELVRNVKEEMFSNWSDEGFNTFMQANYIYAPIGFVAGIGLAYLAGKGVNKSIRKISEWVHGWDGRS